MQLIKTSEVIEMTTLSKASLYRYMQAGLFPRNVSLGGGAIAWSQEEVEAWIMKRLQDRDSSNHRQS
ncbi:helix-turn-helix transcriptional regulator [Vibrio alginolyticus]